MVIVTALPAQAAVQAATLNERAVSAVSTYTGTNAALATSKTAAINTATSTTNTTTNDAHPYRKQDHGQESRAE